MIDFQNVSFSYGEESRGGGIRNINLTIKTGEFVLLTGESGCGKTTITRLVNGLVPHYYEGNLEGNVFLDGKSVADTPLYDLAAMVGSVFQNPKSQFFNVDTDSELAFACENLGYPKEDILQRMDRTISNYHIENLMGRSVFALSGGEKQKIACASSSVLLPGIMVLDEPSSNLDMAAIDDLRQVLSLWKKQGADERADHVVRAAAEQEHEGCAGAGGRESREGRRISLPNEWNYRLEYYHLCIPVRFSSFCYSLLQKTPILEYLYSNPR